MHRLVMITVMCIAILAGSSMAFQCTPPTSCPSCPTPTCTASCEVTNWAALEAALSCKAAGGGCCHIIVPTGAVIDVPDTINLNCSHSCLRLTINGTLNFAGDPGPDVVFIKVNGASYVTIDSTDPLGARLLTSPHSPCAEVVPNSDCDCTSPPNGLCEIAIGVRISGSSQIIVRGLNFTNLTSMVVQEAAGSSNITLENLTAGTQAGAGDALTAYGVWLSGSPFPSAVTITDCTVYGAYFQHCFRTYANDVTIQGCAGYDRRASGLWTV